MAAFEPGSDGEEKMAAWRKGPHRAAGMTFNNRPRGMRDGVAGRGIDSLTRKDDRTSGQTPGSRYQPQLGHNWLTPAFRRRPSGAVRGMKRFRLPSAATPHPVIGLRCYRPGAGNPSPGCTPMKNFPRVSADVGYTA
jgi:hypothetical protein